MNKTFKITTMDNPWNPFTDFDRWHEFDIMGGYRTLEMIARFSKATPEMIDKMYVAEEEYGMNMVLELNPYGIHYKVYDYEADTIIPLANKAYKDTIGKALESDEY